MESGELPDQLFTFEGRLASFQPPVPKRKSTAKSKAPKVLTWPHKNLDPADLARAGFFFEPTPEQPDNSTCFLCLKRVGGWEEGDNPFEEHVRLSPYCGWAIVTAIEKGLGDYSQDDPAGEQMMEARKATFGGRWPHEGKRGWKCKMKQLVEAGWKYTPMLESDDMATCTYCELALDGWEPKDNPMTEHFKRSPNCPFFRLLDQYQSGPTKKTARSKAARSSKASRLSTQSVATTAASEAPSFLDTTINPEDSIMTTTSVATQGGTKRGKAKKTTAKSRKTKAKKDEPIEVHEDEPEPQPETQRELQMESEPESEAEPEPEPELQPEPEPEAEEPEELAEEAPPAPSPPKPVKGRKRTSAAMEDAEPAATEAPAPKKRTTRGGRASKAVENSVVEPRPDVQMADAVTEPEPAPAPKTKGRKAKSSTSRTSRKVSTASTVSAASQVDSHMMDDIELERQLEADLNRPLSDDEHIAADSDAERKRAPSKSQTKKSLTKRSISASEEAPGHHAMFDPSPVEVDEHAIDDELKALEAEMQTEEEPESIPVPKKGRKAGTRKVSKQTTKKSQPPPPQPVSDPVHDSDADELAEGHESSIISIAPVARRVSSQPPPVVAPASSTAPVEAPKKKRGRPSKKEVAAKSAAKTPAPAEPVTAKPSTSQVDFAESTSQQAVSSEAKSTTAKPKKTTAAAKTKSLSAPPMDIPEETDELQEPETPKAKNSTPPVATPAAKQATLSPSKSPQSSDAENQPPSSKPSNTANSSRVALAPVTATPNRLSPTKRHVFAGLQTDQAWNPVDVDLIFEGIDQENETGSVNFLKGGAGLTSPEKRMTVEEWIRHNAEQAEQKLKIECESMVSAFEREGTRAMQAVEGLVVE